MNKHRLEGLADGIFAIIMTLMVIDLKVPELGSGVTNAELGRVLVDILPVFASYVLSFAVLFTYWRAYHFIMSVYAKNTDITLTNYNFLFFFFVALTPFVSHLLGEYVHVQLAVVIYGINVICIGIVLALMRAYVHLSDSIERNESDLIDNRYAYVRIGFPIVCALVAIALSFASTTWSIVFFTIGLLFNIFSFTADAIVGLWCKLSTVKSTT